MTESTRSDEHFAYIYAAYQDGSKLDKPGAARPIGVEMARAEFGTIYGRLPSREELQAIIGYVGCDCGKQYPYTRRPVIE